jgi:hypothetical protein
MILQRVGAGGLRDTQRRKKSKTGRADFAHRGATVAEHRKVL